MKRNTRQSKLVTVNCCRAIFDVHSSDVGSVDILGEGESEGSSGEEGETEDEDEGEDLLILIMLVCLWSSERLVC